MSEEVIVFTTSSDKTMEAEELLNKYISTKITYLFGENEEIVDDNIIKNWLSVNDNLDVIIDEKAVSEYMSGLSKKYNTVGITRNFKTSTGKTQTSATPEAANAILETIKASGEKVGFKASGGIKTTEDAKKYLTLANTILGPTYATPSLFRIGASSVLSDLLKTIDQGY